MRIIKESKKVKKSVMIIVVTMSFVGTMAFVVVMISYWLQCRVMRSLKIIGL